MEADRYIRRGGLRNWGIATATLLLTAGSAIADPPATQTATVVVSIRVESTAGFSFLNETGAVENAVPFMLRGNAATSVSVRTEGSQEVDARGEEAELYSAVLRFPGSGGSAAAPMVRLDLASPSSEAEGLIQLVSAGRDSRTFSGVVEVTITAAER